MYKEREYHTLRSELDIKPHLLDDALIRQPSLLLDAIEHQAHASELRDLAKNDLQALMASHAAELRDTPINGRLRSETLITSELPLIPEVVAAREALIERDLQLAMWAGLVEAIRARGYSIKGLAEMTIAGFLTPDAAYADARAAMNNLRQANAADPARGAVRRRIIPADA